MSPRSKLIKDANDAYKVSPLSSWILGITSGVVIAAIIAIDFVAPFLSLLTFPLLALPIIFSATIQHLLFRRGAQLTVRNSLKGFGLYFTPLFKSSFRFFSSLIKSIIVFFILEMFLSILVSSIMQMTSPAFVDSLNSLYEAISSEEASMTINELNQLMLKNDAILLKYLAIVLLPSLHLASLFMVYNCSRNSIMIYYQMQHRSINPRFTRFVYLNAIRGKRLEMLGDYLLLNWPLYVLLVVGLVGGSLIGYFWKQDILTMLALSFASSAFLSSFFFPFYFGNQEALFDRWSMTFDESTKNITSIMLDNIQRNIDISLEEKQKLEQSILSENKEEKDEDKQDSNES